jgi:hypothetical protein
LEWARDTIVKNFDDLEKYFPLDDRRGIRERLKEVPKALRKDELVPSALDCGGLEWQRFEQLVEYRNGLVHGAPSRPETDGQPENVPAASVLDALPPGWAVERARAILRKLHSDTETPLPDWLSS